MPQALIGALRVNLSMASAKFERGAKRSRIALRRLAKVAKRVGQAMKRAMAAAAVAVAAAAAGIAVAVRRAINEFDDLAKQSRAVGTTVESLSQLRFVAELSAIKVEELSRGIRNFGRNALAGLKGTTDFTAAMDALGVEFKNAGGGIRNFDDVLPELADAFAKLPEGASKTALAMKIFGERVGPVFVNLLNNGAEGLRKLRAEADAVGTTIATDTAVKAEVFNDTLARIWRALGGISNRITAQLLPDLQALAEIVLRNVTAFAKWLRTEPGTLGFIERMSRGLGVIKDAAMGVIVAIQGVIKATTSLASLDFSGATEAATNTFRQLQSIGEGSMIKIREAIFGVREDMAALLNGDLGGGEGPPPIVAKLDSATAAMQRFRAATSQGKAEAAANARRQAQAAKLITDSYHTVASGVTNALASVFSENKGVAVATALINTFLGITKALSSAPPPLNFAQAAAVAASGFAQVANIRKQNKRGSGGGSAGAAAPAVGAAAAGAGGGAGVPSQLVNISLQGETFNRDGVRNLIESINDAVADGAQLRIA